jgi:AcrR family transcriptional regulator
MARFPNPDAHEALLEAARVEFARSGLDGARVEDVARRAGVSKGAFYLHFRTKEDAFAELLQRFVGALEEHARRRLEAEAALEPPRGAIDAALARLRALERRFDTELLEIFWRNRPILAAVESAGAPRYARLVSDFRRRMRALVTHRVHTRQDIGTLRADVDPEMVATVIVAAYEGLGRRMFELRDKPDLAAWAGALLAILYEGLLDPAQAPLRARAPSSDPLVNPGGSR